MRVWLWIVIGLVVVALAVLVFPLVETQRDWKLVNQQVEQTKARVAELERVVANLKAELDAANRARTQLQSGLDEANTEIRERQFEVERLRAELEEAASLTKDAETPDQ